MEATPIYIVPELYTIEKAAALLHVGRGRSEFLKNHVYKEDGLRLTTINGKIRISSIELTRYIMVNTAPAINTSKFSRRESR